MQDHDYRVPVMVHCDCFDYNGFPMRRIQVSAQATTRRHSHLECSRVRSCGCRCYIMRVPMLHAGFNFSVDVSVGEREHTHCCIHSTLCIIFRVLTMILTIKQPFIIHNHYSQCDVIVLSIFISRKLMLHIYWPEKYSHSLKQPA